MAYLETAKRVWKISLYIFKQSIAWPTFASRLHIYAPLEKKEYSITFFISEYSRMRYSLGWRGNTTNLFDAIALSKILKAILID